MTVLKKSQVSPLLWTQSNVVLIQCRFGFLTICCFWIIRKINQSCAVPWKQKCLF